MHPDPLPDFALKEILLDSLFSSHSQDNGFPAFFDINLGAADATNWLAYLQQGLYIDQHTSELTVELVTYNAPLRIFGYLEVDFTFTEGGAIDVSNLSLAVQYSCSDIEVGAAHERCTIKGMSNYNLCETALGAPSFSPGPHLL